MLRRTHPFSYLKLGLAISVIGWLQVGVLPFFMSFGVRPDLLLITAVILALKLTNYSQLLLFAYLCAYFKDIFGARLFGLNALMFCALSSLVYFISGHLYKETGWLKFIFLACATVLAYLSLSAVFARPLFLIGILEALMNCIFLPVVARIILPFLRVYSDTGSDCAHK